MRLLSQLPARHSRLVVPQSPETEFAASTFSRLPLLFCSSSQFVEPSCIPPFFSSSPFCYQSHPMWMILPAKDILTPPVPPSVPALPSRRSHHLFLGLLTAPPASHPLSLLPQGSTCPAVSSCHSFAINSAGPLSHAVCCLFPRETRQSCSPSGPCPPSGTMPCTPVPVFHCLVHSSPFCSGSPSHSAVTPAFRPVLMLLLRDKPPPFSCLDNSK